MPYSLLIIITINYSVHMDEYGTKKSPTILLSPSITN